MKKLMLAMLLFPIFATAVKAQSTSVVDVAMGYSVIEVVRGFRNTANGSSGSAAVNLKNWLGVVSDFGVYKTTAGVTGETYTFGPRLSYRHWDRFTPFTQVLIGHAHASSSSRGSAVLPDAFAFGAGGGAEIGLRGEGRFALQPEAEFLGFNPNGHTTGAIRISVAAVFHIGRKR